MIQSRPWRNARLAGPRRLRRLGHWARSLDFALARRFGLANREDRLFFLLIGVVGVVGGLLGAATDMLIGLVQTILWGSRGDLLTIVPKVHRWVVVAAPAIGGAVLGLDPLAEPPAEPRAEAGGEGMAMLIEAVALVGGQDRAAAGADQRPRGDRHRRQRRLARPRGADDPARRDDLLLAGAAARSCPRTG